MMKTNSRYTVAGFTFRVEAEQHLMERMDSFEPFKTDGVSSDILFDASVNCESHPLPDIMATAAFKEISNDFGMIRMYKDERFYHFRISFGDPCLAHAMTVAADLSHASISLCDYDSYQAKALSALLHILFSMAIIPKGGIMTHASCVTLGGNAYMFLGKSGTGKSTHSALWLHNFAGCSLLNDDNPVVRITDSGIYVYGTPWSGKTPCYKNESAPLKGIARLQQASANRYEALTETAAFTCFLPSCSVIHSDSNLTEYLYKSIIAVCEKISIGLLRCLPDNEAALVCHDSLCNN